jgi:hypothetical protein
MHSPCVAYRFKYCKNGHINLPDNLLRQVISFILQMKKIREKEFGKLIQLRPQGEEVLRFECRNLFLCSHY